MWESSIISELVLDSDSDLSFSNLVLNVFFMISKQTLKSPECLVMRYEQMSIAFVSMNLKIFSTFWLFLGLKLGVVQNRSKTFLK